MTARETDPLETLREPASDAWEASRMGRFLTTIAADHDLEADTYRDLWRWSVAELDAFWEEVWSEFGTVGDRGEGPALADDSMPGAEWFPGARLNYAENALRGDLVDDTDVVVVARSQTRGPRELTLAELRAQVAHCAAGLRRLGVGPGDRVAAYLPNVPEALVAFLATASLGAVWSSCAPEFGTRSVLDRLGQIEPRVLLTVDGYRWGGKVVERTPEVAALQAALPSLEHTVWLPYLSDEHPPPGSIRWEHLLAEPGELTFERLGFDHPLYVLYSSGTTGLPKPIVHGHGGITLEHVKALGLHHDLGPGDRFLWYSTTGWMMWNYLVSGLLVGATVVLFDGDPGHPDLSTLWRLAEEASVTYLGVSAPFLMACRREGLTPGRDLDLSRVRGVGSTGAPLPAEGFRWVYEAVGEDLVLGSISGGTDVCTAFVGPAPLVEVRAGEIPCRFLGADVHAFDPDGRPLVGEQGELVVTSPMPSMPVGLWGDEDGSRLRDAYFGMFSGVWRHGDWITVTERGSCVITGRSDATLNRGGVRMGTSEFYTVVDADEAVGDSLVVHLHDDDRDELILFVAPAEGHEIDEAVRSRLEDDLRRQLSPRHVPDDLEVVEEIPRTLSGKRCEIPVKRILTGTPVEEAVNPGALANPGSLAAFEALAVGRS